MNQLVSKGLLTREEADRARFDAPPFSAYNRLPFALFLGATGIDGVSAPLAWAMFLHGGVELGISVADFLSGSDASSCRVANAAANPLSYSFVGGGGGVSPMQRVQWLARRTPAEKADLKEAPGSGAFFHADPQGLISTHKDDTSRLPPIQWRWGDFSDEPDPQHLLSYNVDSGRLKLGTFARGERARTISDGR